MSTITTAKVTANITPRGTADVNVDVELPHNSVTIRDRTAELGLDKVRKQFDTFAGEGAVRRYRVLGQQIEDAERKVADAEAVIRKVEAANLLLLQNPEPDLANKLRGITAELAAAKESKAAAEADLELIRKPATDHFLEAANTVASVAATACLEHLTALNQPQDAARARLAEACAKVSGILAAAVEEYIAPAVSEVAAIQVAVSDGWNTRNDVVSEAITATCGKTPHTVVRRGNLFMHAPASKGMETPDVANFGMGR
jgi:hypothetical protein